MRLTLQLLLLTSVAACGSSVRSSDASLVDASPPHYHYIIDSIHLPAGNLEARTYGLDLDGNGMVDNQLGMVVGSMSGLGFSTQAGVTTSVDTGQTLLLVDLQTSDLANASASGFTTYFGANAMPAPCNGSSDTTCRRHLAGTGTFDLSASSPHDPQLLGSAISGTFKDGPGPLGLQMPFLTMAPLELILVGGRVQLSSVSSNAIAKGILAGGISQSDVDSLLIPAWQQTFTSMVQRDCCGLPSSPGGVTCNPNGNPVCGCVGSSNGAAAITDFDGDLTGTRDCTISIAEVQNNSLIHALLAPDIMINGQPVLSLGIGFTAVPATFTP